MSIIDSFDKSKPIITPDKFYKKIDKITDICIVTFSHHVRDKVLSEYKNKEITYVATCNGHIPIYYLEELDVLFFMTMMGAANAGAILEEAAYMTGVTKFIYFGSCGILDKKYKNKYIVPTESYRDEGLSYHYAKPSDYITIKNSPLLVKLFEENNIDYISGRNWTTDGIYRETINKFNKRKEDGCVSVEMESSALQAVANSIGVEYYTFFFAGDLLGSEYDAGNLVGDAHKFSQLNSFEVAIIIAKNI